MIIEIIFYERNGAEMDRHVWTEDKIEEFCRYQPQVPKGAAKYELVARERPDGYVGKHRAGAKRPALDQGAAAR